MVLGCFKTRFPHRGLFAASNIKGKKETIPTQPLSSETVGSCDRDS